MGKTRLVHWEKEWRAPAIIGGNDEESLALIQSKQEAARLKRSEEETPSLFITAVKFAKELIFDVTDEGPEITIVSCILDSETFDLVITPILSTVGSLSPNDVKQHLAYALAYDVPVVPNSEEAASELVRYHRDLLINGLSIETNGGMQEYRVVKFSGVDIDTLDIMKRFKGGEVFSPAELFILKETLVREIEARDEAGQVLATL